MDPLSDVLSLLKPQSHVSAGFDAGGVWAIAFPKNAGIKCYAVVSGGCWLVVEAWRWRCGSPPATVSYCRADAHSDWPAIPA